LRIRNGRLVAALPRCALGAFQDSPGRLSGLRCEAFHRQNTLSKSLNAGAMNRPVRITSLTICLPLALAILMSARPTFGAGRVSGQIINGTTGRPASRQTVQLLMPAQGKVEQIAATQTDAEGRFSFHRSDINTTSFYLLQSAYEGVNYNQPVRFAADGNSTDNFKIYDASRVEPPLRISSARVLVRAQGNKIRVEELFALRNETNPPVSYANRNGTFHFRLDPNAGQPSAAVAGEMNLPLPQDVDQAKSPGQFFIRYPLKPGLTVVMVAYESDYSSESFNLADSVPYPIDEIEMDVVPATLAITSPLFRAAGRDTDTGGQKLVADDIRPDELLQANFHGEPVAESASSESQGDVKELPNQMTRLGWPLIGCFLLVLLWAMGVRISKEWARRDIARPGSPALKELETKLEKLLDSLANLDELFEAGKLPEKKYWRERLDLKAKLVVLLRKTPPAFLQSYASRHNPS
jgi:hypothetical protein